MNSKNIIIFVIGVVLISGAIFLGYKLGENYSEQNNNEQLNIQSNYEPETPASTVEEEVLDSTIVDLDETLNEIESTLKILDFEDPYVN